MKTVKVFFSWLLSLLVFMFFSYIIAALTNAEFNPFFWNKDGRVILSFIWFIYLCFSWIIVEEIIKIINNIK